MSWDDEREKAWRDEEVRARQEKWEEKYWSEIEDGLCPPNPAKPQIPIQPVDIKMPNEKDLEDLLNEFKRKRL